jgi:hypothetical protein
MYIYIHIYPEFFPNQFFSTPRTLPLPQNRRTEAPNMLQFAWIPPPLLAELSMAEYDISPISTDTNCHVQSLPRRPGCAVMFLFSLRTWERHTSFCPRPYYHVDSSPSLRPSTRRNAVHERSHVSFHVFANGNICKNLEAGGGGAVCLFRPAGLNNT